MITLYSDEELRAALENAKRRWEDASRHSPAPSQAQAQPKQMQAQDVDFDAALAETAYHRLSCEAAHRWGLVR